MHSGWLLALAVSVDTLFAAMGCRMQGIIIPRRCMLLISLVGTGMLGLSLGCGAMLRPFLPEAIFRYGGICFCSCWDLCRRSKNCVHGLPHMSAACVCTAGASGL